MKPVLAACALAAALPTAGRALQTPVATGTPQVVIDAVAIDRHGRPVVDLKPEEIEVWIGHFRVPIITLTTFTPETESRAGRTFVLLLDDISLPVSEIPRAKEIARRFVMKMTLQDRMAIVTLNGGSMETTSDRAKLLNAVDRYSLGGGTIRLDTLAAHVLDTIAGISRQLLETQAGRKTIVGIGSGWVFDKPVPLPTVGTDTRREWVSAMRATAAAHAVVYAIDPRGLMAARSDGGDKGFARDTGGIAYLATNDANGAIDRILQEASSYYMMAVSDPPIGKGAELRDLEVRCLRRGVTMRARRAIAGE
jgi:VWFA-related protein